MKLLSVLLLLVSSAFAQAEYVALYEANLSAAASVITVQSPATGAARSVRFVGAYVYCAAVCDVTLERDGTAATATAITPAAVSLSAPASQTKAYRSSDVGAGTVIGKYTIPAGGTQVIDLGSAVILRAGGNLSLRTSSITGIARIAIQFREDQ